MPAISTVSKYAPRHARWLILLAGLVLWPGSPLLLPARAEPPTPADAATIEQKLDELQRACSQAGLTDEETKAALEVAKRVQADKRELCKLEANGKLGPVEQRAFDKLIAQFGHPLQKELEEVREVAARAKLTEAETAAAEKLALRESFDSQAILRRYESGTLSAIEKSAADKILAVQGHPRAKELEQLAQLARQAGLSDAQVQTLRALAARADWDVEQIKQWKQAGQLSQAEADAVAKVAPFVGQAAAPQDSVDSEKVRAFQQVAKAAGLTDAETASLIEAIKQAGGDERGLLEAKQAGKLPAEAAAGLKKLEELLGKLEDFVASPHKKEIGKLLEAAAAAGLNADDTAIMLKLAVKADFSEETVKQLKAAGRLSEAEMRILDKLRSRRER